MAGSLTSLLLRVRRNVACVQNQNKINDLEETLQLTVALDSKKVSYLQYSRGVFFWPDQRGVLLTWSLDIQIERNPCLSKLNFNNVKHLEILHYQCTANSFQFVCSQKGLSQVSLLISAKYFQNRIIKFSLELCYSVENYETTVVQEIHISRL
jgi:hypothetical protein